jgi:hypothetical protein
MKLAEVIEVLCEQSKVRNRLTVEEILNAFGARVYGPLLLLPAVIAVFPVIGALPGVSITMAMVMLLASLQLALGLSRPWLPRGLKQASLTRPRAEAVLNGLAPWARRFDVVLRPRLRFLFTWPGVHLTGLLCVGVAVMALIGSLLPALIVPPSMIMILIAFALVANDGALLLFSGALAGGIGWLGWHGVRRVPWPEWIPFLGSLGGL